MTPAEFAAAFDLAFAKCIAPFVGDVSPASLGGRLLKVHHFARPHEFVYTVDGREFMRTTEVVGKVLGETEMFFSYTPTPPPAR